MIEGLHFVRRAATARRPVRWYVYAWRGGPCIMVADSPKRPNLTRDALATYNEAIADQRQVKADTLAAAARKWRGNLADLTTASPEWRKLEATTRRTWGLALDAIEDKWGKLPLAVWNDPRIVADVVAWRDSRSATPRAADIGVTVLAQLLAWCKLRAMVKLNVAVDVPAIYTGADRAEIIWTDDDLAAAKAAAKELHRPRVYDALELATLTGFRRADLIAVTFGEVGEHAIIRTARKKSRGKRRRAAIPLLPETTALIARLRALPRKPGVDTLLVNSEGRPWTNGSLGAAVYEVRKKANIFHPGNPELGMPDRPKHLHDCRGTFVTRLCRARLTDREIADIVAWSDQNVASIRKTYVDDAAIVVALGERIRQAV